MYGNRYKNNGRAIPKGVSRLFPLSHETIFNGMDWVGMVNGRYGSRWAGADYQNP